MKIIKEVKGSTAISAFEYDTETEVLSVKFTSGAMSYDYPNVPVEVVMNWMEAESMGKYFNKEVRKYRVA